jgi:uncharacterized protein (TIGR02145 family)
MNKIYTFISAVLLTASLYAQAPQSFSYQAVVRGANNDLVVNKSVGIKISLLQGSENGTVIYAETHTTTTNGNGLISMAIGIGKVESGTFANIDWSKGPYFMKTETDPTGGTNYTITAISQMLSVPFALYAANSQPGPKGDKGADGLNGKDGAVGPIGPKGDTGAVGPQGIAGLPGKDGKDGLNGKDGVVGPIGPKGDTGAVGPQGIAGLSGKDGKDGLNGKDGPQGPAGNGFSNGTSNGQMMYWDGSSWITLGEGSQGLTLTFCEGKPTWTVNGVCPSALIISNLMNNGVLTENAAANNVTSVISYTGGKGDNYIGQIVTSTGTIGLTATIAAGTYANGNGTVKVIITGTPKTSGTAYFSLTIGGQSYTLARPINPESMSYAANITDIDGNSYKTVYIGTQRWMAENLKVSKYNDGTDLVATSGAGSQDDKNTSLRFSDYTYYNYDETNNNIYGKLYSPVNIQSRSNKNICPTGWHLPSVSEWNRLIDYLGGSKVAGGKLKAVGTAYWEYPNTDATDTYLFSALPAGIKEDNNHLFSGLKDMAAFMSAIYSADGLTHRISFTIYYSTPNILEGVVSGYETYVSIRCVED